VIYFYGILVLFFLGQTSLQHFSFFLIPRNKNQQNKYFHTIFSSGEVSVELVKADGRLLNSE